MIHTPWRAVLILMAVICGPDVLAATESEPNSSNPTDSQKDTKQSQRIPLVGREEVQSRPYRTAYGYSAVAVEAVVTVAEVRYVGWRFLKRIETTTALPTNWSQRLAEQLVPALEDAARRSGITVLHHDEMPACPEDGNASAARLSVEISEIETFSLGAPAFVQLTMQGYFPLTMRAQLQLTDNCDREIKSFVYGAFFDLSNEPSVDEFLERWLVQEESTEKQPSNPRMLADAMVAAGLLVWMPTWPAKDAAPRSTPYTLRALSPVGSFSAMSRLKKSLPVPVLDQDYTLHWESLEELLAALGPMELMSRISNVHYELAVYREQANQKRVPVFRSADLTSTAWNGSDLLESCESFAWSVRAHFRLDGFPRMTAWSALHRPFAGALMPNKDSGYSMWPDLVWPENAVHQFRTPPPAGFKDCR